MKPCQLPHRLLYHNKDVDDANDEKLTFKKHLWSKHYNLAFIELIIFCDFFILYLWKLRLREVNYFGQGHD